MTGDETKPYISLVLTPLIDIINRTHTPKTLLENTGMLSLKRLAIVVAIERCIIKEMNINFFCLAINFFLIMLIRGIQSNI